MESQRILVLHASRLDATAGVAAFVGDVLSEAGCAVHVAALGEDVDLRAYDRIVLGSAIRYDRWLPEAVRFVDANRELLSETRVDAFFTCLVLARQTSAAEDKAMGYAKRVSGLLPSVAAEEIGRFAGVLDCRRAPWPVSWMLRLLSVFAGVAEGDYREWEAVREWALGLAETRTTSLHETRAASSRSIA